MKKRAIIIHGWDGHPEEGWFPWLARELEQSGFHVIVPQMPSTQEPKIELWVPYLAEVVGTPDTDTYLIGHSMGGRAIFHYLNSLPLGVKVGGVLSVAGALILNPLRPEEQAVFEPWLATPIDPKKVRTATNHLVAILSDTDRWVPLDQNRTLLIGQFEAELQILSERGHFSGGDDGTTELPEALTAILAMSSTKN